MTIRSTVKSAFLVLALFIGFAAEAQPDGKALFKGNCAQCHNRNMRSAMTGPALGGVQDRWESEELLYAWIRNSQAVVASGNTYAVNLYNEWNKSVMQSFPNLADEEIAEILLYIDGVYNPSPDNPYSPKASVGVDPAVGPTDESGGNNILYFGILLGVLVVLALLLARIISNLNHMTKVRDGEDAPRKTFLEILGSKSTIAFIVLSVILIGGFKTVNNAIDMGRQQDYMPDQPIKFSHELHAGINKIDCQYCHDGARRSKHSVIPATNTCMNCHSAIEEGPTYGRAEITKIYASAGYNPNSKKYINNYEELKEEEVSAIYSAWLKGGLEGSERSVERKLDAQLGEVMSVAQKPIEWVRIHNLPDHAYFNHAQHVTVGQVECQTCHGPVEEMEVVYQYSPLSMGWCINCHRQTEVKFKDNPYYEAYHEYQKDLKDGNIEKVYVEDIGGLECQKCHY